MVNWQEIKEAGILSLSPKYGVVESKSMLRILHEDLFEKKKIFNQNDLIKYRDAIDQLQLYVPIQYITGISYFMGLKLKVNSAVLIPRFETEELVAEAVKILGQKKASILEIGTGSGCIALGLKHYCKNVSITAIDISEPALMLAKQNAQNLNLDVDFQQLDIFEEKTPLLPGLLDMIISNPPYISADESHLMDKSTIQYEPHIALFAGSDPLIFYKLIAILGQELLKNSGNILVEINEYLAKATKEVFESAGYKKVEIIKDIQNKERMILIGF